jgi:hypothetical protein
MPSLHIGPDTIHCTTPPRSLLSLSSHSLSPRSSTSAVSSIVSVASSAFHSSDVKYDYIHDTIYKKVATNRRKSPRKNATKQSLSERDMVYMKDILTSYSPFRSEIEWNVFMFRKNNRKAIQMYNKLNSRNIDCDIMNFGTSLGWIITVYPNYV